MTRLASASLSCFVALLAVLPSGLAGPACATKNYRQQQCIERCKAKWGYPGSLMGGDRWGSVMRKVADKSTEAIDAAVSQACGFGTSTDGAYGALAGATESITSTSIHSSSTVIVQTSTSSSSASVTSASSTSSSATTSSSSSSTSATGANLLDGYVPPSTSTSSTPTTTSTSETPTSTSTTEESTPTSEPPPPPPTTTSSTPESTPTSDSGNNGSNGSGNGDGNKDQGSSGSEGNSNSGSSGSTSNSDIQAYLSAHNSIRAQHGASDLTWSDDAASKAQTWANNCVFEHSGGKLGPFGENLAAGSGDSYGITDAIKSWTDEVSDYQSSSPQPSHFTQVVWKGSTQVGCAVASCDGIFPANFGKAKFYVCEYFPQGNVIGQFAANVLA